MLWLARVNGQHSSFTVSSTYVLRHSIGVLSWRMIVHAIHDACHGPPLGRPRDGFLKAGSQACVLQSAREAAEPGATKRRLDAGGWILGPSMAKVQEYLKQIERLCDRKRRAVNTH